MKQQSIFLKAAMCLTLLLFVAVVSQAHAQSLATVVSQVHAGSITPPPSPSRGALDIGQVGHTGAFVENGTTERIWASGSDIWRRHDQFHYVWFDLPADGQLVTQVLGVDNTNNWAKAGIMLRDTVADNAANVFLALTPGNGVTFQWRGATNGLTSNQDDSQVTAPTWLKLARHNSTITGFVSDDGTNWTTVGSETVAMGATSSIGLAVTAHNNQARNRAIFRDVKLTLGAPTPALTATRIYGQGGDFTTNTANNGGISASSLSTPADTATDSSGNLYVSDYNNNRVLFYPAGSTTATRVYGQGGSFSTGTFDNGGISATSLSQPTGLALDSSGNLYVADTSNDRVLFYPAGSTTATRVYGQGGSFSTNTANNGGISANSLYYPYGVALDSSGNLYVADDENSRVLFYPAGSTTATRVYGQAGNFTTDTSSTNATSLSYPTGIAVDSSNNLYIADYNNHRTLFYPAGSTTATRVYGQGGNFTTGTANNGGISANSLSSPYGVTVDNSGNLYIADYNNHRTLFYPAGSTTATRIYGQGGNLTTGTANNGGISATSLNNPWDAAVDSSGNLYITDSGNNRVLMFPAE